MAERSTCGVCGGVLPGGAAFCPTCGGNQAMDGGVGITSSVEYDADDGNVVEGVSEKTRLSVLAGVWTVSAVVVLVWVFSSSGGSSGDSEVAVTAPISTTTSEALSQTPITSTPGPDAGAVLSTTSIVADESETRGIELSGRIPFDGQGDLFADDVDGVVVVMAEGSMYRLNLFTGTVTVLDLRFPVELTGVERVVVDGEVVSTTDNGLVVFTDLNTGAQRVVADLGSSGRSSTQVVGLAGPGSVWLAGQGDDVTETTATEIDTAGHVLREIEFSGLFSIEAGRGDHLYLRAPNVASRYDTRTGTISELEREYFPTGAHGAQIETIGNTNVIVAGYTIGIVTDDGVEPLPSLHPTDHTKITAGTTSLHVSPDQTEALLYRSDREELSHLNLVTGERSGPWDMTLWTDLGVIWLPNSRWIITMTGPQSSQTAVNTDTGEHFTIEHIHLHSHPSIESALLYMPAS